MSSIKRIMIALIAALILITAPSCASKSNESADDARRARVSEEARAEGVKAAKAAKWLIDHGADPEKLNQLSNRQVIEFYEAVQRRDRSVTTDGVTINIEPIVPTGPMGAIGPRKPDINFPWRQLQKKYNDHAPDFGVFGNANKAKIQEFQAAMERHIADPSTRVIVGTYKQTIPVTHYVNPTTGLNVMKDAAGDYISGWRLNPTQLWNVLNRGSL
jgi:hypothetical protein